ncbi:AraC family transcriptional regulator [Luteibacter rhizovicinus]|uniref:AraC family transcriptional regulator n=1 Tax=Luteibacter rhizovicinus TaxID=242606 RepID=A0A4R3YUU5_9GAMM|nr:helix-turn-helix domain-containing protein [Luteibacter rhizovicinus]TCV96381.1 AraC family transcriptional regulator [Luteibacter rhizovicinus]
MGFVHHVPPKPFDSLIESIWDYDCAPVAHAFERILPAPGASLILNLLEDETRVYADDLGVSCTRSAGSVVSGPYTRSFVIDTHEQQRVMGIVFRPGGAWPFFGTDLDVLSNTDVALDAVCGASARALRERLLHTVEPARRIALLQAWLIARARGTGPSDVICGALGLLDADPAVVRIGDVVAATGLSSQRFGQLFRAQVGLSAKRYARLQRFRVVIATLGHGRAVDWAGVAADGGFCDQAHLVHEFRSFAGMTPGDYLRRRGEHINHVPLA